MLDWLILVGVIVGVALLVRASFAVVDRALVSMDLRADDPEDLQRAADTYTR